MYLNANSAMHLVLFPISNLVSKQSEEEKERRLENDETDTNTDADIDIDVSDEDINCVLKVYNSYVNH
jgi:hypothetical protein